MIFIVSFDNQLKNQHPIKCAFCYTLKNNLHHIVTPPNFVSKTKEKASQSLFLTNLSPKSQVQAPSQAHSVGFFISFSITLGYSFHQNSLDLRVVLRLLSAVYIT